jgi:AraC-like DNA-binding protein
MSSAYHEHQPSPALTPFVECYWSRVSGSSSAMQPAHAVLPDGCMDIVFNFGDVRTSGAADGTAQRAVQRGGAVVGTMTVPLLVAPGPREDFFGVRFHPGMARAFLCAPAAEFTDISAALADVWGREVAAVEDRLAAIHAAPTRIRLLERELLRRLPAARPPEPCVAAALHLIEGHRGAVTMREACRFAGVSRQHLARRFAEHVGVSPKMFARVTRFRSLLTLLRQVRLVSWSDTAAAAGYYDQSHLIADFRQFTGRTPEDFLAMSQPSEAQTEEPPSAA